MGHHRAGLASVLCLALQLGCGDDDAHPMAVPRVDAGAADSGSEQKDAGKPAMKDAGKPVVDSGPPDSGKPDAGTDSGPTAPVDSGPGDVGIDAGPPPGAWKCAAALWADGYCDCGCGVADFDCVGQNCIERGCVLDSCDACYTEEYAWKACTREPDPSAWKCTPAEQGSDSTCDCGCGLPDPSCGGSGCSEPGCWRAKCNVRHAADASVIDEMFPPFNGWTCAAAAWGGGDGCDCGCGATDPDCRTGQSCTGPLCNANECHACHDATGRVVACSNALASEWTCDPQRYGSGDGCDCGCGAKDPDCAAKGCSDFSCRDAACKRCTDSNYAAGKLVGCADSSKWTCDASHYGTGDGCDCGCGVKDPDCSGDDGCTGPGCQSDKCEYCHAGNSADPRSDNDYIICDPPGDAKGWTCGTADDPAWKNGECDCGCGRPDPYCRLTQRASCTGSGCKTATCEFCNANNAARAACDGPTWSTEHTCKTQQYAMDGKCDCGCGAIDPDCGDGEGCAAPYCAATGCEVCHGPANILTACLTWTCPKEAYGDGHVCDCGCGAPDPDCSGLGCSEPGCKDSACSPEGCHDPLGRSVRCP